MSDEAKRVAAADLRELIERIENREAEKATIADEIKDIYGEAKGRGYDPKALKRIIALRKMDEAEREEAEIILDTYLEALGMKEAA